MTVLHDSRRTEIIAAACTLIMQGGLEGLTFAHLEKSLPFTRGVITYHFKNRAAIVEAVLEHAFAEIEESTASSHPSGDSIAAAIQSKVMGFVEHREASAILLTFWMRAGFDPLGERVNTLLTQHYREQAAQLFVGQGPEQAALLVSVVLGIVLQLHHDPSLDAEALITAAAQLFAPPEAPPERRLLRRALGVFSGR